MCVRSLAAAITMIIMPTHNRLSSCNLFARDRVELTRFAPQVRDESELPCLPNGLRGLKWEA